MRSTAWIRSNISRRFPFTRGFSGGSGCFPSEDVEKLWVQRQKYYGLDELGRETKGPDVSYNRRTIGDDLSHSRELIDLIEKVVSNLK